MSYQVGVDVGGTFTTAAVVRGGRAEVAKMVPSLLPGVPRGFLRRVGDDTPVLVGTRPVPAETLVAQLVQQVVQSLGKPAHLAVTHPVAWGPHRVAALRAALGEVTMLSTAAAVAYQSKAPTAVHDLGGTTFTAAVVHGLATVGQPVELDLGGADLDELVLEHVRTTLGDAFPTDPAALARLRQACTVAKETLSADTEVEIPVADTRVRLTRAEFEDMARPLLAETAAAFRLTIEESGVTPATVLLTGGAAWLPLLTQVISEELGRPVTATPPGAAAMGAALAAAGVPLGQPDVPFRNPAAGPLGTAHNVGATDNPARPNRSNQPTRLAMRREPLPVDNSTRPQPAFPRGEGEPRTTLVAPVRPPVPIPTAPPESKSRRPRAMVAAVAATFVVVGAAAGIALATGQTPAGAGAETGTATSTVTQTVRAGTTTTDAQSVTAPTRQTPPKTQRPAPRVTSTTTKAATTTTTITMDTTTSTTATTTTTTSNSPANSRTSAGGR